MSEHERKNSLITLTKGFISMLVCSGGGEVDITAAEKSLNTTKRRLYDVVNVLAGIGLLEKCGKAKVRWTGVVPYEPEEPTPHPIPMIQQQQQQNPRSEREELIDSLLASVNQDLNDILDSGILENYGWVTPQELLAAVSEPNMHLYAVSGSKTMYYQDTGDDDGTRVIYDLPGREIQCVDIGITGKRQ